ncbi:hypothetical protein [Capnocytophaga sp.]|uniref:hypothetical protein n=1 Tax=Capnocytophaga sp. TaxID=44737 RepID=UPI0026DAAFAB|nr:hypothetical protein [Capnocytophaga sp.]MDO5106531.1 hypothetical protein [Capnocytophaga sp.]
MTTNDHNKIIKQIAKPIFKPHNIKQKGQSRIWIFDGGWYLILIEFQPFSGRQGTTLNVGVHFNWYEQDYFSFDIGSHQDVDFVEFNNVAQFSVEVEKLCQLALQKTLFYQENLSPLSKAKQLIINYNFTSESIWGSYHKGVISGLMGDFEQLHHYFERLLSALNTNVAWQLTLKQAVESLIQQTNSQEDFEKTIAKIVQSSRKLKKLPDFPTEK